MTIKSITPFLWFDSCAEEAANFYVSLFPDSRITHVSRYGDAGPGPAGSVMVVAFELCGRPFLALNGGPHQKLSEAFSMMVECTDQADIERLHSAAMFHDIGKAKIPLAVLDKPGRLDDDERALIETHPATGYDALKGNADISPEILDAVRHHHEYLDGSGYPDGLCSESITDVVRMLTISDIFAALIEERHYKPAMPRDRAYEILKSMHGKLEMPLVAAFREVALTR